MFVSLGYRSHNNTTKTSSESLSESSELMTYSLPSAGELPEAPSVLEKSGKQQSGEKDTNNPLETNIRNKQKRVLLPDFAAKHPLKGLLDKDDTMCKGSVQRTKEVQKMPKTTNVENE